MTEFLYKTKDGSNPRGKSKVYFVSHPDDFDEYFEVLSNVIFEDSKCVIYYKKNLTEMIEDEDKEYYFKKFNLMIVPITKKLFTNRNAAVYSEIAYAKANNIPLIPFIVESSAIDLYNNFEYFKNIQYVNLKNIKYVNIFGHDSQWRNQLTQILDAVLLDDETASVVKSNFDGQIFLSYRKMDRKYAHELVTFIHSYPEFRNVSIWYDEYLTLGENFQNEIEREIQKSDIVLLLMTPNTTKYCDDGNPNYMIREEYPVAKDIYKKIIVPILPESISIDMLNEEAIRKEFPSIPNILSLKTDKEAFLNQIRASIKSQNTDDPECNLKIVDLEGKKYDEGLSITPINVEDFDKNDVLIVQQVIEPLIISTNDGSIIKSGTVMLSKAEVQEEEK